MSKKLSISQSTIKTNTGMFILDFFYGLGESDKDEVTYRFYVIPAVYHEVQLKMGRKYKVGDILHYVKSNSDEPTIINPNGGDVPEEMQPEKKNLQQTEFQFESNNFKTFCVERSWMELLGDTEAYSIENANIHPLFDTKMFTANDKDGGEHTVLVNAKYGSMNSDQFAQVYFNRLPDAELADINVDQNGLIFEFGTDMQQTILNIFDRRTTVRVIATVYQIMDEFGQRRSDAQWVIFGGFSSERSKMKMYDSIANELAQKFNLHKKVIQGNEVNETFYVLYR